MFFQAPKARNVIGWAIGPGASRPGSRALKARNDGERALMITISPYGVAISRFQRLKTSAPLSPRALPWAFTFRAFGACNSSSDTGDESLGYNQSSANA